MSATIIDRNLRRRKARIGEGAHGDAHRRLFVTFFGMEHSCPAGITEPEPEPGALITDANVFGRSADDLVRGGEAGQRCKDTARPTLTGEAVANANAEWFAVNFNAQLAAGTRGCSRTHQAPRGSLFAHRPYIGVRHGTGRIARFVARAGNAARAVPVGVQFDCDNCGINQNRGLAGVQTFDRLPRWTRTTS
jgi:hypothetical protein